MSVAMTAPKKDKQLARYEFKKKLQELRNVTGRGTELISLYIPPDKVISDAASYLRNERSQSMNIKSKSTRKNVGAAIDSILSRLKYFKKPPETGVVFFVGHKTIGADQTEMVAYVIEPPEEIPTFLYRCDSKFYLEPLEDMLKEKECFGLIVIDRNEAAVGILRGKKVALVKHIDSHVPRKHRKGGQSSRRFERLIEQAAHEFFKKVGDIASDAFLQEGDMKGVLVGGPGATKEFFMEKDYLHHEIKKLILGHVNTGYTDEYGLKELVDNAAETFTQIEMQEEKELMNTFFHEVRKDKGLATYGLHPVIKALELGMVDTLLLSEEVTLDKCDFVCPKCGKEKEEYILNKREKAVNCRECGEPMERDECEDAIEEMIKMSQSTGSDIRFISGDTDEGSMLISAFGGLAAILRYQI